MHRIKLDHMSTEHLREEARRCQLQVVDDRDKLIDTLMTHCERNSPTVDRLSIPIVEDGEERPVLERTGSSGTIAALTTAITSQMQIMQQQLLRQMQQQALQQQQQQQNMMQQMIRAFAPQPNQGNSSSDHATPAPVTLVDQSPQGSGLSRHTSIASTSSAHAVTMLASQIPEFGGLEEKNVQLWIQRIEQVTRIHKVNEDVTLLAATSRLVKTARRWFDLGSGSFIESWSSFREAILKRFTRKILYHVAMQKIEARKWNFTKESFLEYAMDKLALIHGLNLNADSAIHLLISGIGSRSLRETAASLKVESIDEFLDSMHQITSASADPERRSQSSSAKVSKSKDSASRYFKSAQKQDRREEILCNYCKKTRTSP